MWGVDLQRFRTGRAATLATVAAGFVVSMAVNWPGQLSYDSVVQLQEGRTARYGNWHPPVMSWLLGLFDAVLPGTGLFVLFDGILLFAALAFALVLSKRSGWPSAVFAGLCVLSPQYLLYAGVVWKDVLFAASAVLGFAVLATSGLCWTNKAERFGTLAAAALLLSLAALARQNGAVVLPFAAITTGLCAARTSATAPVRKGFSYGLGWLAIALAISCIGYFALETRSVGQTGPRGQFRLLATYDLAGALHDDPALQLPILHKDAPVLERLMRGDAQRLYTPERNDTLARSSALQSALLTTDEEVIPAQWRAFMLSDPLLYLRVRWDAFRWVFFTPDRTACRAAFAGVTGPPSVLGALGLPPRFDGRDRALTAYGSAFSGTPLFSHAFFAALGIGCLAFLLKRRSDADLAFAALLSASFAFVLSFFVIAIACDYRYLYLLDVASIMVVAYLAEDFAEILSGLYRRRWRGQTKGASA